MAFSHRKKSNRYPFVSVTSSWANTFTSFIFTFPVPFRYRGKYKGSSFVILSALWANTITHFPFTCLIFSNIYYLLIQQWTSWWYLWLVDGFNYPLLISSKRLELRTKWYQLTCSLMSNPRISPWILLDWLLDSTVKNNSAFIIYIQDKSIIH